MKGRKYLDQEDGIKNLETVIRTLGVQRTLWEIAKIINGGECKTYKYVEIRNRYSSQFAYDLHYSTTKENL